MRRGVQRLDRSRDKASMGGVGEEVAMEPEAVARIVGCYVIGEEGQMEWRKLAPAGITVVEITRGEAIRLIGSLAEQMAANDPNAGRITLGDDGQELTIAVTPVEPVEPCPCC